MEKQFIKIDDVNYSLEYFKANPSKIEELKNQKHIDVLKKIIGVDKKAPKEKTNK